MRRVKLCVATSLDGYIAGLNEEIDWIFSDQDYGMAQFFASVDTVLMGRKSHDLLVRMGQKSYGDFRNVVFSRSPKDPAPEQVEWVTENAAEFVNALKREPGKDIWLFGGGELFMSLLDSGVVDDVTVALHPIVLGSGLSLYPGEWGSTRLQLMDVESFTTGLVLLMYRVDRRRKAGPPSFAGGSTAPGGV